MDPLSPPAVREALADLGLREQKIVAGLFGVLVSEPSRVHDIEWVSEQLTQLAVLAGDHEDLEPHEALAAVRDYLQGHAEELIRLSVLLFKRVGADLADRVEQGFTFDEAMRVALDYLPST